MAVVLTYTTLARNMSLSKNKMLMPVYAAYIITIGYDYRRRSSVNFGAKTLIPIPPEIFWTAESEDPILTSLY